MNTLRFSQFAPLCLVLSLASAGCDDPMEEGMDSDTEAAMTTGETGNADTTSTETAGAETAGAETAGPGEVDEAAIKAMADDFANLTQVSDVPTPSAHALADTVTFYVADDITELYLSIDPEDPTEVTFPEGALIVKENLDEAGASDGYFAMYKGPEGYDPEGNDWYWLRVDAAGAVGNSGTVGFCKDCHGGGTAVVSDFVFGVPLDNRL